MSSAQITSPAVTVRCPAKVNLELLVGGVRPDGFHTLSTIYQAVSLYDEVTVEPAETWSVTLRGQYTEGVPTDGSNLAVRAAKVLADRHAITQALTVTIRKDIPVAGGMAGGSADAAATLLACDALWGLNSPKADLEEIAAELGSDIPFLLHGGTAIGSGRGELLAPVLARGTYHWVFVAAAGEGLSTPAVYREFDRRHGGLDIADPRPTPELMAALRTGDVDALAAVVSNDLQPAALALNPALRETLDAGMEYGALAGFVSGSGPTCAFLTASAEASIDLAVALSASEIGDRVHRAHGPVLGAHLR
ncbi:4-(cytidine 5'-diphospho)-2-C-methyl-D-erythritol kinase [Kribbia dieselivorans]|uniref:4-(cytidine 5'-diphospho)-2-C-methyl-D-erythritol kinase n=1 Tax=Kribbia dieselivorans TaxID=331526 RepID=UPI0008399D8D|nr:4-(cytidine 5'-diphospho)-2-C-methyl-D-erythritol kinase [Kribbia dieselivorans]